MATWLTPDDPRLLIWWPGARDLMMDDLTAVLESARVECEAYAPTLPDEIETAPVNYLHAQALQARALSRVGLVGDASGSADMGQTVTLFPMDWTVKTLLRPPGKPVIS